MLNVSLFLAFLNHDSLFFHRIVICDSNEYLSYVRTPETSLSTQFTWFVYPNSKKNTTFHHSQGSKGKLRNKVDWVSGALKSRTFCFRKQSVAAFSFCFRTEMSIPVLQIAKTLFIKRNVLTLPLQRVILVRIKKRWELTDQVTTEPKYWMIKWTGQVRIIYNFNTETVKLRFSKHFSAKNKNLVTQSGTRSVQYPLLPRNNTVYLHWSWVLKEANFFKLNPAL